MLSPIHIPLILLDINDIRHDVVACPTVKADCWHDALKILSILAEPATELSCIGTSTRIPDETALVPATDNRVYDARPFRMDDEVDDPVLATLVLACALRTVDMVDDPAIVPLINSGTENDVEELVAEAPAIVP